MTQRLLDDDRQAIGTLAHVHGRHRQPNVRRAGDQPRHRHSSASQAADTPGSNSSRWPPACRRPRVRMPALGLVPEWVPEMAAILVAPGDIHTNVPQRFWDLTAVAGNNPLAPDRWPAML
ncbi:MAG: hypothetical protein PHR16_14595 [Methylovulum sp.]|nr:hypothetical protein [Methylovulum sp.]